MIELKVEGASYIFSSDDDKYNRLTFVPVSGVGYIYLRGRGSVILPSGETVRLGR